MLKQISSFIFLVALSFNAMASNNTIDNFSEAKRVLYSKVYKSTEDHKTFYCGCDIERQGKKLTPNLDSCGYENRNPRNYNRATRIEAEHIVPAAHIGYQNKCMIKNKSMKDKRGYCEKNDPDFKNAYIDLHNLVPSIGEVNLDRSNFRFTTSNEVGVKSVYGKCDIRIDTKGKRVVPPDYVKGDIARTYLYMSDRYDIKISDSQRKMFVVWDKEDPADEWEIEKNKRIKDVQGNSNPYIQDLD
jgi:deoxyribonuclease-1